MIIFCMVAGSGSYAQVHPDFGQLTIENYSPKVYKSHPQNWAIAQDQQGVMYFGNKLGVLIYDGQNWDLVKTLNESTVRSLDVSPKGKVFVGADGDFGYIKANKRGMLSYVSLRKLYNIKEDKIGNVLSVQAFDQGVYFLSKERIFFYNGRVLKVWESETSFNSAFKLSGSYVVNEMGRGLCKMVDDSLVPIRNVFNFKDKRIYDIIESKDKGNLVLTESDGLQDFLWTASLSTDRLKHLQKLNSRIDAFNPDNGSYLANGYLCIGTWGNGLLFIDDAGRLVQQVNSESGLIDEVITDQYLDHDNNLWLTTSNGIAKIPFNHTLSQFREKANVNETVEKIVKFNDRLFFASHTGIYAWKENETSGSFEKIEGIDEECWDLLPVSFEGKNVLLIAGNNAVYELDEKYNIEKIVSCLPWTFHQLKADPNTIFVGLDDGLMSLSYEDGSWKVLNHVAGISNAIFNIAEAEENRMWLGTLNNGVIRLDVKKVFDTYNYDIRKYGEEHGLPEGGVFVAEYVGGLLFGTSDGVFEYNLDKRSFKEETIYKNQMGVDHLNVHRIKEDAQGNLWLVGYWDDDFYMGYFKRNGSEPEWCSNDFKPISKEVYHSIYNEGDITWLGGPDGLYRHKNIEKENDDINYHVLIRRVYLNKDSLDFAGNKINPNYGDTLEKSEETFIYPYDYNSLTFSFSSQYHKYDEMNQYSYMLVGFEDDWSAWTKDKKAIYTNLYEGEYTFLVRSKNIYGRESDTATYQFVIEAPWYRTWWAFLIYVFASAVVVYFVILMYTKRLKAIIKERTAEVVLQKEKIEKQKDEVEHQRKQLEIKNADITSSINYARRLQEALLPNEELINKYLKENFIIYKPKDIVSGDFYWMEHVNGIPGRDLTLFATVDCTGHGVPGAFVSVVGNGGLNRAVNEYGLTQPASILDKLNEIVIETLSQNDSDVKDGMDISLCCFDFKKMEMQYAGANNSVYIIRKGIKDADLGLNGDAKFYKDDLCEIKPNRQPVGYYEFSKQFVNKSIKLEKGDMIYLFSDGYTDQFGGPQAKKFNVTRFKNLLLRIHEKPMKEQRIRIEKEFDHWKGNEEQIDDVIVAGIRIS